MYKTNKIPHIKSKKFVPGSQSESSIMKDNSFKSTKKCAGQGRISVWIRMVDAAEHVQQPTRVCGMEWESNTYTHSFWPPGPGKIVTQNTLSVTYNKIDAWRLCSMKRLEQVVWLDGLFCFWERDGGNRQPRSEGERESRQEKKSSLVYSIIEHTESNWSKAIQCGQTPRWPMRMRSQSTNPP